MSEWKEFTVTDFAEILDSKRVPLSTLERQNKKGPYPYYGASGIIDYIDEYIFEGEHLLVSEDGENLKSRKTPIAFRANGKFWVNNHAHILKGRKKHHNRLLEYLLEDTDLFPFITGAVQPKLSKSSLQMMKFPLPDSDTEQEEITEVLSSLDDKIDLLHRQNKTLEQLAETLFRQWFVEEAEEGWEIIPVGDVFETKGGGTPSTEVKHFWNGNICWTSPRDLSNSAKIFLKNTERKLTEDGLAKISSGLLPKGTVLLSSRAPIGYLAITAVPLAINQGYIACQPNDKYSSHYIHNWLKANMEIIKSVSNGSTFMEISKSTFRKLDFLVPPQKLLQEFKNAAEGIYNKIQLNEEEISTLESLRDSLLPKLLSGLVTIKKV